MGADSDSFMGSMSKEYDIVYSTSTNKLEMPMKIMYNHNNSDMRIGSIVIEEEGNQSKVTDKYGLKQVEESTSMMNIINP